MKIDFSAALYDEFNSKPLTTVIGVVDGGDPVPLTLGTAAIAALMQPNAKDDGKIKFELYELARKINAGGEIAIEPKDAETIKQRIGAVWAQAAVGPAYTLLNGPMK